MARWQRFRQGDHVRRLSFAACGAQAIAGGSNLQGPGRTVGSELRHSSCDDLDRGTSSDRPLTLASPSLLGNESLR